MVCVERRRLVKSHCSDIHSRCVPYNFPNTSTFSSPLLTASSTYWWTLPLVYICNLFDACASLFSSCVRLRLALSLNGLFWRFRTQSPPANVTRTVCQSFVLRKPFSCTECFVRCFVSLEIVLASQVIIFRSCPSKTVFLCLTTLYPRLFEHLLFHTRQPSLLCWQTEVRFLLGSGSD